MNLAIDICFDVRDRAHLVHHCPTTRTAIIIIIILFLSHTSCNKLMLQLPEGTGHMIIIMGTGTATTRLHGVHMKRSKVKSITFLRQKRL